MLLIDRLQTVTAPHVFTPRAAYDGRKNMFAIREFPFPDGSQEVTSPLPSCCLSVPVGFPQNAELLLSLWLALSYSSLT